MNKCVTCKNYSSCYGDRLRIKVIKGKTHPRWVCSPPSFGVMACSEYVVTDDAETVLMMDMLLRKKNDKLKFWEQSFLNLWKNCDAGFNSNEHPTMAKRIEELEMALDGIIWQEHHFTDTKGRDGVDTWGLYDYETAFAVLGWDDPHYYKLKCPKCDRMMFAYDSLSEYRCCGCGHVVANNI